MIVLDKIKEIDKEIDKRNDINIFVTQMFSYHLTASSYL